jgi:hypothetical protein
MGRCYVTCPRSQNLVNAGLGKWAPNRRCGCYFKSLFCIDLNLMHEIADFLLSDTLSSADTSKRNVSDNCFEKFSQGLFEYIFSSFIAFIQNINDFALKLYSIFC